LLQDVIQKGHFIYYVYRPITYFKLQAKTRSVARSLKLRYAEWMGDQQGRPVSLNR